MNDLAEGQDLPVRDNGMWNPADRITGAVGSLHIHPAGAGNSMCDVKELTLVEGKGIVEDKRYFARQSRTGEPTVRQVSLIEREQICEHADQLGVASITPGMVRANIETIGVRLCDWIGGTVEIGSAVLLIKEARTPCSKMDAIAPGLRQEMENGRQGVLAQVVRPGKVRVGDPIQEVK
jgi:MOSC domain-containing protein YiiM